MQGQTVHIVFQAIRYIEDHLNDKLELDIVAAALHYSKFHLHFIPLKHSEKRTFMMLEIE